jgi:hypothetical protein
MKGQAKRDADAPGKDEVFNAGQGSPFTSEAFTKVRLEAGVNIKPDPTEGVAVSNVALRFHGAPR